MFLLDIFSARLELPYVSVSSMMAYVIASIFAGLKFMIIKFLEFKQAFHPLSHPIKVRLALGLHEDVSFYVSL